MRTTKRTPEQFFHEHAGYSYDPKTQTPEEGRKQYATQLAKAERFASENDYSFEWTIDPDASSADWISPNKNGGKNRDPWNVWGCIMRDADGRDLSSLWSIDFGRDGSPWSNPYRRVIEAELASEFAE